jgi:ribosomal protein S18 acetylase RimI-like enzyme
MAADIALEALTPEETARFQTAAAAAFARTLVEHQGLDPARAAAQARAACEGAAAAVAASPLAPLNGVFALVAPRLGRCGHVWLTARDRPAPDSRHLLYIVIEERFRRRGLAEAALRRIEDIARGAGVGAISLHVFDSNRAAVDLYRKLGFEPYPDGLVKWLRREPGCPPARP